MKTFGTIGMGLAASAALGLTAPAQAQFRNTLTHDTSRCSGNGPAVWMQISNISEPKGKLRVQLYRATKQDWLEKGRWINRIELPASASRNGAIMVCMPVPSTGNYAIAVRHDVNGNGSTDLTSDGGGMSNNPSINIFNLGKPSVNKTAFSVGSEVKSMSIRMRYL